jgi:hypothetical protein
MATFHRAYLFDVDGYKRTIDPIVARLLVNDTEPLRIQATAVAERLPSIWPLLEDYRLYPDDLRHEANEFDTIEGRARFWMLVILASFWQPVDTSREYARIVSQTLRQANVDEDFISDVTVGKPLVQLICPYDDVDPITPQHNASNWPYWCRLGMVGWLSKADINSALQRLISLHSPSTQIAEVEHTTGYRMVQDLLTVGHQSGLGLFMAIFD